MKYNELTKLVELWAEEKGIFDKSDPLKQLEKTQEELIETRDAACALMFMEENLTHPDPAMLLDAVEEVKDGIGDMLVTIIIAAKMLDLDTEECLTAAYKIIAQRKGKMVNGVFVKDSSCENPIEIHEQVK